VLATGATECLDCTKVALPEGTTHVDVTARSDRSEQRLVIGGLMPVPRSPVQVRTGNWERARQGVQQAKADREEACIWSAAGIVVVLLWLTGETVAWLMRLLFRARTGWQCLAAAFAVTVLAAHWWESSEPREGFHLPPRGHLKEFLDATGNAVRLLLSR
jgi:hypothetical protein